MTSVGGRDIHNGSSPMLAGQQKADDARFLKDTGYVDKVFGWLTKPVQTTPNPLDPERVSVIGDDWSKLIEDLAEYLVVDVAERQPNEGIILNVSKIIQDVLLAIGSLQSQDQTPDEKDSADFGRHLIANILKEFYRHDLTSSDPGTPEGEAHLRLELTAIFENLLEQAGLDERQISSKPTLVQEALYPSWKGKSLIWVAKRLYDLPSISRDELEKKFVTTILELLKLNKKLETKSNHRVLDEHDGLSTFVDNYLVPKILSKLREGNLPFEYPFLRSQKNKDFLTSVMNQVLSQENQTDEDGAVITETWEMIEKQLTITIKSICTVVLKQSPGQETAKERRVHIIDGILNRLVARAETLNKRINEINLMDSKELAQELKNIPKEYQTEAKKLLDGNALHWEQETRHLLKKIEYAGLARLALKKELNADKFSKLLTKIIPAEKIFALIYQFLGEIFLEFDELRLNLEQRGQKARSTIEETNIKEIAHLIDKLLPKLIEKIEEKADQHDFDVGYSFLNDMVCHLLRKPEAEEEHAGRTALKEQTEQVFKNILIIVITTAIERNSKQGVPKAQAFSDIINTLVRDAREGISGISLKCLEFEKWDERQQQEEIDKLADKLEIGNYQSNGGLVDQYRELHLKLLTRKLIEELLPQDLFNSLLPPKLQHLKLWEMVADDALTPYFSSIYETTEPLLMGLAKSDPQLSDLVLPSDPDEADVLEPALVGWLSLAPEVQPYITPVIDDIVAKLNAYLDNLKLYNLLNQNHAEDGTDLSVLDQIFGGALGQNGEITGLIKKALRPVIESFFAFHLNPQGQDESQDRAAELFWKIQLVVQAAYNNVDKFSGHEPPKPSDKKIDQSEKLKTNKKYSHKDIAKNLWLNPRTIIADDMAKKINEVSRYLEKEGLELKGVKGDGNCYCHAFLESYRLASLKIPALKGRENDIAYVRNRIAALYEANHDMADESCLNRAEQIKKDREYITADGEGNALAADLKVPIRTLTVEFDNQTKTIGIDDMLTFPEKGAANENWEDIVASRKPEDYIFIVDVGGHFLTAHQSAKKVEKPVESSSKRGKRDLQAPQADASGQDAFLHKAATELLDLVIPEDLWDRYVPQKFSTLISRDLISQFLVDYLREGYEHSVQMKEFVDSVKIRFEDEKEESKGEVSFERFIEEKVDKAFEDAATVEISDGDNIRWVKEVLQKLLEKEKGQDEKSITKTAILIAYAIFGKLLSGGLDTLASQTYIDLSKPAGPVLKGSINQAVQIIRESFYELNDLEVVRDFSTYTRLAEDNLERYLEIEGSPLQEDEYIDDFFRDKADPDPTGTLLHIKIRNDETGEEREETIDVKKFAYWELGYQAIDKIISDDDFKGLLPNFLQKIITKELLAGFSTYYMEACHNIQGPLQKEAEWVEELAEGLEDLKPLIEHLVIEKIKEKLDALAKEKEPLFDHLPIFFDTLLKNLLSDDDEFKRVRDILIKRAVYLLLSDILEPAEQDQSAEKRSVENIREKIHSVIAAYQDDLGNPEEMAVTIVDLLIPQTTWNIIFTGKFKDLISRKQLGELLKNHLIKESYAKIETIKQKHDEAVEVIEKLDHEAGLTEGHTRGLKEMVETMCDSIDETIDEYAEKQGKIFDHQPLLVNEITKDAFKDPTLSIVIKEAAHSLVLIAIARMLQVKTGQSQQERLLELLTNLIEQYDADKPVETAAAWIDELFPDDLRKEILPNFLYDVLTPEFLAESILKDYVVQVNEVAATLRSVPSPHDEDEKGCDIIRVQTFVREELQAYVDPAHSEYGLTGFGGFVKIFESVAAGLMAEDHPAKDYLNHSIAQIMSGDNVKHLLDKQFISKALTHALPSLLAGTAKNLPDDVEQQCAVMMTSILFPSGKDDLPFPEIARGAVWKKLNETLADQVARITNRDQRILTAIKLIGTRPSDKAAFEKLEAHYQAKGNLNGQEKAAEHAFTDALMSFAMTKIETNVAVNWPQPIKCFAVQVLKIVSWLMIKIGVNQQLWKFISDVESDKKFRSLLWELLSFAKDYSIIEEEDSARVSKELGEALKQCFDHIGLLYGMRSIAAPRMAEILKDKNLVDLIVG